MYIVEPQKRLRITHEVDLCVIGGSCTGVFAAIRAARLGLRVLLIEQHNILGGTAVSGLVNIWHSLYDTDNRNQIIAGLTAETVERLQRRDAIVQSGKRESYYNFNPFEHIIFMIENI